MKRRFSEEQIIGLLKQHEAGAPVAHLCREHNFSAATFYKWKSKYGGMDVAEAKRLRQLEDVGGSREVELIQCFEAGEMRLLNSPVRRVPLALLDFDAQQGRQARLATTSATHVGH